MGKVRGRKRWEEASEGGREGERKRVGGRDRKGQ